MAEAAVEDSATNRFFCHKCSIEITRVLEDYTCPTCLGGFIEELDLSNTSSDERSDDHSDDEMDEFFSDVQNQLGQYFIEIGANRANDRDSRYPEEAPAEGDGTGRRYRNGTYSNLNLRPSIIALIISLLSSNRARHSFNAFQSHYGRSESHVIPTIQIIEDFYSLLGMEPYSGGNMFGRYLHPVEHTIQDFINNLTGVGWGPMGPGGRGNEPVFFLGNPGDYVLSRGGLDAIATVLLNQMDGTGPPPLDKEKIREIPVTVIEQEQVDSNLQCSVCWDDFKVGETVRKLECEHFYHESCIVPWLELHGTCPICRKSLLGDQEEKTPTNSGNNNSRSNLAAMLQAVRSRDSTNMLSASSSSGNSTMSTSNTNPSNEHQPPPPPSDFQMDLEYD